MSEQLDTLVDAYTNGQIDFIKNKLKHWDISFSEFFDYFIEVHGELVFIEDLKLLVRRVT